MVTETVQLALLASLVGPGSALLLAWQLNRNAAAAKIAEAETAKQVRDQDYARQDLVAERAQHAAEDAIKVGAEAKEAAQRAAEDAKVTNGKLTDLKAESRATHTLVNSNYTIALQAQFDAIVLSLASLKELADMRAADNQPIKAETTTAIATAEKRISELRKELDQRAEQGRIAAKQLQAGVDAVAALKGTP